VTTDQQANALVLVVLLMAGQAVADITVFCCSIDTITQWFQV
jgi:hypothetical protein